MPKLQMKRILLIVTANLFFQEGLLSGEAFVANSDSSRCPRTTRIRTRSATVLKSIGDDTNDDAVGSYWKTPNDFSMFLTQRSIQSFMFLTSQLRDPETCYWVEDFTQPNLVAINDGDGGGDDGKPKNTDSDSMTTSSSSSSSDEQNQDERTCNLLRYHGLAAMDTTRFPTWENYFESMLERPTDSWVIASDRPHIPDYTWEIDPNSLCSRILSVREQLSKEFAKDLQAVSDMGGQTFDWYWEKLKQSRANLDDDNDNNNNNNNDSKSSDESSEARFIEPSSLRGSRENLLFLEINVDNPTLDHKPSPLRRSNFDLLVLLATEEAIHRVLNRWEFKRSEGDLIGAEEASHSFLEEFYQERQHFFHGPLLSFGKADDLLEELLDSALLFKPEGAVVHPTKIAELVLKERERVALDWMEIAKEAPMHHMRIQKLRLEKIMSPNAQSSSLDNDTANAANAAVESNGGGFAQSSTKNGGFDPGPGAFE